MYSKHSFLLQSQQETSKNLDLDNNNNNLDSEEHLIKKNDFKVIVRTAKVLKAIKVLHSYSAWKKW